MQPRAAVQVGLHLLVHVPVYPYALGEPAARDLILERLAVVAVAGDVE